MPRWSEASVSRLSCQIDTAKVNPFLDFANNLIYYGNLYLRVHLSYCLTIKLITNDTDPTTCIGLS